MRKMKDTRPSKPRQNPGVLNPRKRPAVMEEDRGATSQQPKCKGARGTGVTPSTRLHINNELGAMNPNEKPFEIIGLPKIEQYDTSPAFAKDSVIPCNIFRLTIQIS